MSETPRRRQPLAYQTCSKQHMILQSHLLNVLLRKQKGLNKKYIIFFIKVFFSFSSEESSELLKSFSTLKNEDLDLQPPPLKKMKTEPSTKQSSSGRISLYEFLTRPLHETRNSAVEVKTLIAKLFYCKTISHLHWFIYFDWHNINCNSNEFRYEINTISLLP